MVAVEVADDLAGPDGTARGRGVHAGRGDRGVDLSVPARDRRARPARGVARVGLQIDGALDVVALRNGASHRGEQVRVGRALAELPQLTETFSAGRLSYSKVRALVRVATPATEGELVDLATMTTAAQLERIVTAYVGSTRDAVTSQLARRGLTVRHEDDGSVTIVARLPCEAAELVLTALDTAVSAVPEDAVAPNTDDALAARGAPMPSS